jgi:hypothetical protein
MHWRNTTRDWPDADADRVSWRLVEGLEDLLATLEDRGGGQINYVRLRRPPTGKQASRTKSRYVGWDNLDDCKGRPARDIAAELTAAAVFVSSRDKCGQVFEAQITYTLGAESGLSKSISFNLDDGPSEDDDEKSEADDEDDEPTKLTPNLILKMMGENPIALMMLMGTDFNSKLVALAEQSRRVEQSRYDRLLGAFLERDKMEESMVDRFVKMIDPMLVHAADMTKLGYEALTSQAEQISEGKTAEADLEIKKARLETIASGFGGLKDLLGGFALDLLAHKMGVDPNELKKNAAAANGQQPQPSATTTTAEQPMDPNESAICQHGRELRSSLTNDQLNRIEAINKSIADKLRALDGQSGAVEIRVVFGELKELLANNKMTMLAISDELTGAQQLAVLQLLNLIYGGE